MKIVAVWMMFIGSVLLLLDATLQWQQVIEMGDTDAERLGIINLLAGIAFGAMIGFAVGLRLASRRHG